MQGDGFHGLSRQGTHQALQVRGAQPIVLHAAPGVLEKGVEVFEFVNERAEVLRAEIKRRRCFGIPVGIAARAADTKPVGGPIACAGETFRINERFQQNQRVAADALPIAA